MNVVGNFALSTAQIASLQSAFVRPSRSMGELIAGVVVRESHRDEVEITDHPVERGSVISDHAIKRPAEVTIECGWSNSPSSISFLSVTANPRALRVQEVYQRLLKMMNTFELVDVLTGKRKYTSMLLKSLETTTDKDTENSLIVQATFREVRIVGVVVLDLMTNPDEAKQVDPKITAPTLNAGTKQLQPAPLYNPQAGP